MRKTDIDEPSRIIIDRIKVQGTDSPACVVVAHNELERFPGFLAFYRSIGVREFWVIDNGSDDGSLEYLREQPDVNLFVTTSNYGKSRKGLRWSRSICDKYLEGRWVFIVDVDELFAWPGFGSVSLNDFIGYLDEEGFRLVFTQMIDFFPRKGEWSTFHKTKDFLTVAPCFDAKGYAVSPARNFPFFQIRGGVRSRLLPEDALAPILQKMPLIKWTKGEYFLKSVHYFSKVVPICDCVCALAHFKFSASSEAKFKLELDRGQRWGGGKQYVGYHEAMQATDRFHDFEHVVEIGNLADLQDHGFLVGSPRYMRFLESKSPKVPEGIPAGTKKSRLFLRDVGSVWESVARANAPKYRPVPALLYDLEGVEITEAHEGDLDDGGRALAHNDAANAPRGKSLQRRRLLAIRQGIMHRWAQWTAKAPLR